MSKSLKSMSISDRKRAITRRIKDSRKGLGYWAAIDAIKKGS